MPASKSTTSLADDGTSKTSSQPYIVIPGLKRPMSRKVASNPSTGIKALVIPDRIDNKLTLLKVSLMYEKRVLYHTLNGHKADIVDLEFLQTKPSHHQASLFVLGSCDRDGVVFLWFLCVSYNQLHLLKKYSFFTLRRSTSAYYNRIRLAGSVENGTMVLVPNDGTSVRVVSFHCQTLMNPNNGIGNSNQSTPLITTSITNNNNNLLSYDNNDDQLLLENTDRQNERQSIGLDDVVNKRNNNNIQNFDLPSISHQQQQNMDEQHGVSSRSTMNSSLAQARADATVSAVNNAELDPITQEQEQRGLRQVVHVDVVRSDNNPNEEEEEEHVDEDEIVPNDSSIFPQHQQPLIGSTATPTQMTDALIVEGEGLTGFTR